MVVQCKQNTHKLNIHFLSQDLKELAEGMVDTVLYQFGSQEGKIDFQEFVYFVQVSWSYLYFNWWSWSQFGYFQMDPSAQSFLRLLANTIDF